MRLLVIEDNPDIRANLIDYLELRGYTVDAAHSGTLGLELATTQSFDLILLDLMLPGLSGYSVASKLRNEWQSTTPIIMLTARDALDDRLLGFDSGADDYLIKPFALEELAARIEVVLKRSSGAVARRLQVADLTLDLDTLVVTREGQPLHIKNAELTILTLLMRKSPHIVSRQTIEEHLWGEDMPDSDSLRTHIYNLRNAIDKPFSRPLLHTLRGQGYRLTDEM
ncbi:response regulator transcription factor [Carnimonas nigrificans]|uniref:response regulator transcription factor n=1 Tax=Carnimonas nigrificans TaxID=64323 RepID=UPI0004705C6A|nr:response regulator transcription factor [Carnimonas nigrificans]